MSLSQALGKPVREADFTDDRLGIILSRLGDDVTQSGEQIELALGQHLVCAYELPTDTVRIDTTTVSMHHQPETEDGLMKFGRSKDHRPVRRDARNHAARFPAGCAEQRLSIEWSWDSPRLKSMQQVSAHDLQSASPFFSGLDTRILQSKTDAFIQ